MAGSRESGAGNFEDAEPPARESGASFKILRTLLKSRGTFSNRPRGLFEKSQDLFERSQDLFQKSPGLFEKSQDLFEMSQDLFEKAQDLLEEAQDLLEEAWTPLRKVSALSKGLIDKQ